MPAKRAAHGNNLAHNIRHFTRKFACIHTPKAPANQADLFAVTINQLANPVPHAVVQIEAVTHVVAQFPSMGPVTKLRNILS